MMTRIILNILSTAILIAIGAVSSGRAISVIQSINKTEMAFEDSAVFEITVEWPGSQFAYRFPKPLDPYIDRLKVGKFSSSISSTGSAENERTIKKFTYQLMPTSSGLGKIDPITVNYVTWPDSVAGELVTEPVTINIAEQKVVANSSTFPKWIPIIGVIMLLGTGAVVFAAVSKARKQKKPVKSPSEAALESLTQLKAESGTDLKRFQTGVYNILSDFLSSKFEIKVVGLNEDSLVEKLSNTALSENEKEQIKNWLAQAELDKFRPVEPSPGDTVRLETELRRFFENVKN